MKKVVKFIIAILIAAQVFASCSSKPKNPGDIYTLRAQAEKELDLANKDAVRGNYENALLLLNESRRKAILTDDTGLIIRNGLSRGNVFFSLGREEEAFAEWENSVTEARKSGDGELLSVSIIHKARGKLLSGKASAKEVLDEVNREAGNIEKDLLYVSFSWQVKGLALRDSGSFKDAEDAVKRSFEIHEKNRQLDDASYDWFLIASIRSLSGNLDGALQALDEAIALDRRIENSWGLAADWRAKGDVYRKAARMSEANEAYKRAINIYEALGNSQEVLETENRMNK